jgi:4-hydroxybenzoate polyprenyltransferase
MLGRCLAMTAGALLLAGFLLALGVPGAVLLGLAPALVCVGMHLVMGHGSAEPQRR